MSPSHGGEGSAFQCPYAEKGRSRCPEWRCDCFIATHPDSPFDLHPEAFVVGRPDQPQPTPEES